MVGEGRWPEGTEKILVECTTPVAAGARKTQSIRGCTDLGINGIGADTLVVELLHGMT